MLHRLLPLWQPLPTAISILFMLVVMGIGEAIAEQCRDGDFARSPVHHVWFATRSFSLPNYWVWYQKEAVHEAIEAQGRAINTFLLSIIFNASMATPAVCVGLIFMQMFVAVRVLSPLSKLNWMWLLPVVAFFADVTEDILLLIITLGYPNHQYPTLMEMLTWCSFIKFLFWLLSIISMVIVGVKYLVTGARVKENKE
eukprot:GILI01029607.1.p1 GENE.GILI01029607.1~~GILI01029607.1.p1  ORF type:complete len:198 (-),score=23.52 GILI01029607.1:69-662(-)